MKRNREELASRPAGTPRPRGALSKSASAARSTRVRPPSSYRTASPPSSEREKHSARRANGQRLPLALRVALRHAPKTSPVIPPDEQPRSSPSPPLRHEGTGDNASPFPGRAQMYVRSSEFRAGRTHAHPETPHALSVLPNAR